MKTLTKKNAETKAEFAALIFAHKNDDFNSFMVFTEGILEQYADEVSREECIKYLEFVVDYCDEIIYGEQAESYYEAYKEQEEQ